MADRRPLIVIPARFSAGASALRYRAEVAAAKLVQAVYDAGGEPLVMHPDVPAGLDRAGLDRAGLDRAGPDRAGPDRAGQDKDELYEAGLDALVRARLWMADGVLLPGGGDLAAHWAGQSAHHSQYDVDEVQDAFDLALARVAVEDRIPLLAICRGCQVVNVARGGDLIQDLAADHRHRVHTIGVLDDSPLREVVGGRSLTVSCYHHQGIARPGKDLRPAAFADDGTIEAVTLDGHEGWYLGVQWHPEDTADTDPRQAALFGALVAAAR